MNYSIGLTLRYFIFYKQTQIKGKSIHIHQQYPQHSAEKTTSYSRQYRTPHTAAITITAFTRYFSMHLHSLPISLLSFPALLTQGATSAYSLTYFTHPSLTLFCSLSFTISTNSQKTLPSLVHTRFPSFHHSQKTNFSQSIIDHPSP